MDFETVSTGAIVWATTIVVATWPLMMAAQKNIWGKRALAVTVMTLLLLCVLVVPLIFAIGTIVSNVDEIVVSVPGKITGVVGAPARRSGLPICCHLLALKR